MNIFLGRVVLSFSLLRHIAAVNPNRDISSAAACSEANINLSHFNHFSHYHVEREANFECFVATEFKRGCLQRAAGTLISQIYGHF